jgi:hypothetical protein
VLCFHPHPECSCLPQPQPATAPCPGDHGKQQASKLSDHAAKINIYFVTNIYLSHASEIKNALQSGFDKPFIFGISDDAVSDAKTIGYRMI